jgi:hypothetical protein
MNPQYPSGYDPDYLSRIEAMKQQYQQQHQAMPQGNQQYPNIPQSPPPPQQQPSQAQKKEQAGPAPQEVLIIEVKLRCLDLAIRAGAQGEDALLLAQRYLEFLRS